LCLLLEQNLFKKRRARQLEQNRKDKTARKGKACKAARTTGQLEQDSLNGTARMGQEEQDCKDKTNRTRLPAQDC
jgi:hypothetical protein